MSAIAVDNWTDEELAHADTVARLVAAADEARAELAARDQARADEAAFREEQMDTDVAELLQLGDELETAYIRFIEEFAPALIEHARAIRTQRFSYDQAFSKVIRGDASRVPARVPKLGERALGERSIEAAVIEPLRNVMAGI